MSRLGGARRKRVLAPIAALAALGAPLSPAGAAPAEDPIRLLRSGSGTRQTQRDGRFDVEDPRTAFTLPQDRQVLVFFEWDDVPPGRREFEGRWKDPSGEVVLVSPVTQQVSTRRFAVYWTLTLPETAASGRWMLEAIIDGRPAGSHPFEVRGGRTPPLSPAQIYARAKAAAAVAERLGTAGEVQWLGVASALDSERVAVPFRLIDGATGVRVGAAAGRRL